MKERLKRFWRIVVVAILMLASLSFTTYVLASSYETVFNYDLPVVNSLEKVDLSQFGQLPSLGSITDTGNYGYPQDIQVPAANTRFALTGAIKNQQGWLARSDAGHYLLLSSPKTGYIGDTLVYLRTGLATIPANTSLGSGANIFIDTNRGWRYFYRVEEEFTLHSGDHYTLPSGNSSRLLLVLIDPVHHQATAVVANFVNLQNGAR